MPSTLPNIVAAWLSLWGRSVATQITGRERAIVASATQIMSAGAEMMLFLSKLDPQQSLAKGQNLPQSVSRASTTPGVLALYTTHAHKFVSPALSTSIKASPLCCRVASCVPTASKREPKHVAAAVCEPPSLTCHLVRRGCVMSLFFSRQLGNLRWKCVRAVPAAAAVYLRCAPLAERPCEHRNKSVRCGKLRRDAKHTKPRVNWRDNRQRDREDGGALEHHARCCCHGI